MNVPYNPVKKEFRFHLKLDAYFIGIALMPACILQMKTSLKQFLHVVADSCFLWL